MLDKRCSGVEMRSRHVATVSDVKLVVGWMKVKVVFSAGSQCLFCWRVSCGGLLSDGVSAGPSVLGWWY